MTGAQAKEWIDRYGLTTDDLVNMCEVSRSTLWRQLKRTDEPVSDSIAKPLALYVIECAQGETLKSITNVNDIMNQLYYLTNIQGQEQSLASNAATGGNEAG